MRILELNASARHADSVSRRLAAELVDALGQRAGGATVTRRDLSGGLPLLDEAWIGANFTPAEQRTVAQRQALQTSDELVAELRAADVIVIGAPIYNFGIPASLKIWIDMIARARLTFRYTDKGPEGLLKGKKAYIVIASGGVPVGGKADFATPYLRHALAFVGITDIEFIAAERLNSDADESIVAARLRIAELTDTELHSDAA